MTQGNLTIFTQDRHGYLNSALALNGGWTKVPSGDYFNTPEFTVTFWVLPQRLEFHCRAFDFGNGFNGTTGDDVLWRLDSHPTFPKVDERDALEIYNGSATRPFSSPLIVGQAPKPLKSGEWNFLAGTFDGSKMLVYRDGVLVNTNEHSYVMPKLIRKNCYFGRSYDPTQGVSWSFMDDIRFYNKSLNQVEILEVMNLN